MGSPAVAEWIAYIAFLLLAVYGLMSGELGLRGLAAALIACVLARVLLSYIPNGGGMYVSFVAAVDIALVLVMFRGDVRL
jgi:hypothetical protein